jgi:hypothetical protein
MVMLLREGGVDLKLISSRGSEALSDRLRCGLSHDKPTRATFAAWWDIVACDNAEE